MNIIKHKIRGLSERTQKSYIWRVCRYMEFHKGKDIEELKIPQESDKFISSLYAKDWIVYCKPPFKNANSVIEYLRRYTHRVAILNSRILNIDNGKVTFKWRDYRDKNKMKTMILDVDEFIRRFILHILQPRFMKIRHFGL